MTYDIDEAHITRGQWGKMELMISEVHDALLGTMDRPGGVLNRLKDIDQRLTTLETGCRGHGAESQKMRDIESRIAPLEADARGRAAGWHQARWIVLGVVLSSVTAWVISAVANNLR